MKRVSVLMFLSTMVLLAVTGCKEAERHELKIKGDDPVSCKISKLVVDMRSDTPMIRRDAAQELGNMKADREGVRDALADGLKDANPEVRMSSARALKELGSLDAYQRLRDASKQGYQEPRIVYTELVQELRSKAVTGDRNARNMLEKLGEKYICQ